MRNYNHLHHSERRMGTKEKPLQGVDRRIGEVAELCRRVSFPCDAQSSLRHITSENRSIRLRQEGRQKTLSATNIDDVTRIARVNECPDEVGIKSVWVVLIPRIEMFGLLGSVHVLETTDEAPVLRVEDVTVVSVHGNQ